MKMRSIWVAAACIVLMLAVQLASARPTAAWQSDVFADATELSASESLEQTLHQPAWELADLAPVENYSPLSFSMDGPSPRRWWPLLLSLAVPGLGEATTGHWRGYPLIGADLGVLIAAQQKNQDGKDIEKIYKAYADEHYSQALWESHLRGEGGEPISVFFNDVGSTPQSVALYVSKGEDEREWYENIGKWEVFFFGWEEYDPGGEGYWPSIGSPVYSTPTREKYVQMRADSNSAFGNRDNLVSVAMLLRVFSVFQVAYLEGFIGGRYAQLDPQGGVGGSLTEDARWFMDVSPRGNASLGLRTQF